MGEMKLKPEETKLLLTIADQLSGLADSVKAVCSAFADSPQEPEKQKQAKKAVVVPLEKVRGVLAEKSRDGFTAEVREIIQSFGADRLSEINPADYEAVLKKAEVLGSG